MFRLFRRDPMKRKATVGDVHQAVASILRSVNGADQTVRMTVIHNVATLSTTIALELEALRRFFERSFITMSDVLERLRNDISQLKASSENLVSVVTTEGDQVKAIAEQLRARSDASEDKELADLADQLEGATVRINDAAATVKNFVPDTPIAEPATETQKEL